MWEALAECCVLAGDSTMFFCPVFSTFDKLHIAFMNTNLRTIQVFLLCCAWIFCTESHLTAQTLLLIQPKDSVLEPGSMPQAHLGWGLSYTVSDVSSYQLTLNISAFGAYTISPFLELAFAVHFNQSSISEESKGYLPVFQTSSATFAVTSTERIAYSVSGDVTLFLSPFATSDTDWRKLRIGVGPSSRVLGMILSTNNINIFNGERFYVVRNTRQHSIGGHLVVEYLLPLSSNVDIALRGQAVAFAPSFYTIGDKIPIAQTQLYSIQNIFNTVQTISLGAFLRINF
jgi:hypothetical protein